MLCLLPCEVTPHKVVSR